MILDNLLSFSFLLCTNSRTQISESEQLSSVGKIKNDTWVYHKFLLKLQVPAIFKNDEITRNIKMANSESIISSFFHLLVQYHQYANNTQFDFVTLLVCSGDAVEASFHVKAVRFWMWWNKLKLGWLLLRINLWLKCHIYLNDKLTKLNANKVLFVHHSSFSALILCLRGCGKGIVLKEQMLDLRTLTAAAGSISEDWGWKDLCSAMPGTSVASLPGTGGSGYSGSYLYCHLVALLQYVQNEKYLKITWLEQTV